MAPEARIHSEPSSHGTAVVQAQATASALQKAIHKAVNWLLSAQTDAGYWWAELEADTTLESDYILLLYIVGNPDSSKIEKLSAFIREKQLADGGWSLYPGGPAELNATVKAYFALKLVGDSASAPHMERARKRIHQLGGLEHTNSYVRFYLALVGALGWESVPAVPPELVLLPNWFFINLYEMSSWTRAIVVPMTILYARKPGWRVSADAHIDELFVDPSHRIRSLAWDEQLISWKNFFLCADRLMKVHERLPWKPFRSAALRKAQSWTIEHLQRSEGLATIFPAMVNSVLALLADGRKVADPAVQRELEFLRRYEVEDSASMKMQPCISPVWDTAIAMVSLEEAGLPADHPALTRSAEWLLDKQIFADGDWQVKNRDAEPGGWAFEFENDFFPDVDDTAFVLMALSRVKGIDEARQRKAVERGLRWLLSMQNGDGGWGAFDRDNDLQLLNYIPFADHNAMLDPATADVTARVLECLGQFGWNERHDVVQRGWKFLQKDRAADGPWYGRWGVNYVYGTSGVLRALRALGMSSKTEAKAAAEWLRAIQNPDGGFGETIASYDDPALKGTGRSTASQTAWGLIGLLAVHGPDHPDVRRAVNYLITRQAPDGSWEEHAFTGTGFPRVFYMQYHYYRNSFPLYALARYNNLLKGTQPCESLKVDSTGYSYRNRGN